MGKEFRFFIYLLERFAEHRGESAAETFSRLKSADLLDYAEGCYEMALAWALEAEYTMMEAAYEIDYYNERFGAEE